MGRIRVDASSGNRQANVHARAVGGQRALRLWNALRLDDVQLPTCIVGRGRWRRRRWWRHVEATGAVDEAVGAPATVEPTFGSGRHVVVGPPAGTFKGAATEAPSGLAMCACVVDELHVGGLSTRKGEDGVDALLIGANVRTVHAARLHGAQRRRGRRWRRELWHEERLGALLLGDAKVLRSLHIEKCHQTLRLVGRRLSSLRRHNVERALEAWIRPSKRRQHAVRHWQVSYREGNASRPLVDEVAASSRARVGAGRAVDRIVKHLVHEDVVDGLLSRRDKDVANRRETGRIERTGAIHSIRGRTHEACRSNDVCS